MYGGVQFVVMEAFLARMGDGLELWLYWVVDDWWYIFEVGDTFLAQVYFEDGPSATL
jgi:hypothetical protein